MCGRYVTPKTSGLVELFKLDELGDDLPAESYNARPVFTPHDDKPPVPIVLESIKDEQRVRRLLPARWKFAPSSSKDPWPTQSTFNARSEGIASSFMWRAGVKSHRAIFPAVGYFETQGSGKSQKRFYFHPDGDEVLALGGVYSWWKGAADSWLLTAAIITIEAPSEARTIHHRAPLVLPPDSWEEWLDPRLVGDQGFVDANAAVAGLEVASLRFHQVAWLDEDTKRMIEPVDQAVA